MTISAFLALPEWEQTLLIQYEDARIKRLRGVLDAMVDKEQLTADAYATIITALY